MILMKPFMFLLSASLIWKLNSFKRWLGSFKNTYLCNRVRTGHWGRGVLFKKGAWTPLLASMFQTQQVVLLLTSLMFWLTLQKQLNIDTNLFSWLWRSGFAILFPRTLHSLVVSTLKLSSAFPGASLKKKKNTHLITNKLIIQAKANACHWKIRTLDFPIFNIQIIHNVLNYGLHCTVFYHIYTYT